MIAFIDQLLQLLFVCNIQVVFFSSQCVQLRIGMLHILSLVQQSLLKLSQLLIQLHHLSITAVTATQ